MGNGSAPTDWATDCSDGPWQISGERNVAINTETSPVHPPRPLAGRAPLIRLSGISKSFAGNGGRIDVLADVDFAVHAGQSVAIVGASGIGKSTLLNIIGTLDMPDRGTLFFADQNISTYKADRLARFRNESIGFVFQFHHLLPEFSALENVMMPLLIGGAARSAAKTRAGSMLVGVGLENRLNHGVAKLSGGEQQRVALARALVRRPLVLLADEPTGNLDQKNAEQVHQLLMKLNRQQGMTLIVVTHNPRLAARMSRKVTIANGMLTENVQGPAL